MSAQTPSPTNHHANVPTDTDFEDYIRTSMVKSKPHKFSLDLSAQSSRSSSPFPSPSLSPALMIPFESDQFRNYSSFQNSPIESEYSSPPYTGEKPGIYSAEKSDSHLLPGHLPHDVYETMLPWWRAAIRRKLVQRVEWESKIIAKMQDRIRTSYLDAYFVYTSSLGTHTFFMTVLPALFFFGYEELGRGLLIVLALGVYCSSVVKDLICSPRPFAPPVTRLTIGSHHLEYGFPSTHSTNSVSIALFLFSHIHRVSTSVSVTISPVINATSYIAEYTTLNTTLTSNDTIPVLLGLNDHSLTASPYLSTLTTTTLYVLLLLYTVSIVFGRLYTAMHSFTDCIVGVLMGAAIWFAYDSHLGLGMGSWIEAFIGNPNYTHLFNQIGGGWWRTYKVPLILIPFTLLAVNQHPQPVDDCPCFEDAIAFASVVLGSLVGKWAAVYYGWDWATQSAAGSVMPGSLGTWVSNGTGAADGMWVRSWTDVSVWWLFAAMKMVFGILVIFTWRLLAKSTLHLVLPPTFRMLARVFRLPNRRFYTPATDYKSVPSEFNSHYGLQPIPSVIDLPGTGGVGVEIGGIGAGDHDYGVEASGRKRGRDGHVKRDIKMRGGGAGGDKEKEKNWDDDLNHVSSGGGGMWVDGRRVGNEEAGEEKTGDTVKHYDADVLTKVIVYAGIAVFACELLPLMFVLCGWGVKSWV